MNGPIRLARATDEDLANLELHFGRFAGHTLVEVAKEDPNYFAWLQDISDWGADHADELAAARRVALREMVSDAPPVNLTKHQSDVVEQLLHSIDVGNRIVRLGGGAGVGKSYATRKLVVELAGRGYRSHAMAVSYVATQVLASQLDDYNCSTATVARSLHFNKEWKDGVETYEHSEDTMLAAKSLLKDGRALIVDECSMVSDRDADLLLETSAHSDGILILVGDPAQLPPVGQNTLSRCCTAVDSYSCADLTVSMRYAPDSPLARVEAAARKDPWRLSDPSSGLFAPRGPYTRLAPDSQSIFSDYVRAYSADPQARHTMLFFRRAEVANANREIRNRLYGADSALVEDDESLMIMATTDTPFVPDELKEIGDTTRYYSGQTFRVCESSRSEYRVLVGNEAFVIPHWRVRFEMSDGIPSPRTVAVVFAVTETRMDSDKLGGKEYQAALQAALQHARTTGEGGKADWTPFRKLKCDFVRVSYTYATTVHRIQGQTVDYAYCIPRQLIDRGGLEGRALTYVACTRARKRLSVLL